MEQFREKQLTQENKEEKSVLEEDDFKNLIESRKIKPGDFHLIEDLSCYPKDLFIDLHNYFGFSRENTVRDLERDIKYKKEEIGRTQNEELKSVLGKRAEILSLFLEFAQKYDWTTCKNLNGVFERRKEPGSGAIKYPSEITIVLSDAKKPELAFVPWDEKKIRKENSKRV